MGRIRDAWARQGFEGGKLGLPVGNIDSNPSTGISWQQYEKGFIVGKDSTGYFVSKGRIREIWQSTGYENGSYGFPISDIITEGNVQYQKYQKGTIYNR